MIRPGPASIEPGTHPGGVVIHVYEVPSQRLLAVSNARGTDAELRVIALADADAVERRIDVAADGVCLVAFDGDTGERMTWPR